MYFLVILTRDFLLYIITCWVRDCQCLKHSIFSIHLSTCLFSGFLLLTLASVIHFYTCNLCFNLGRLGKFSVLLGILQLFILEVFFPFLKQCQTCFDPQVPQLALNLSLQTIPLGLLAGLLHHGCEVYAEDTCQEVDAWAICMYCVMIDAMGFLGKLGFQKDS